MIDYSKIGEWHCIKYFYDSSYTLEEVKQVKNIARKYCIPQCTLLHAASFIPYINITNKREEEIPGIYRAEKYLASKRKNIVIYQWSNSNIGKSSSFFVYKMKGSKVMDLGPMELSLALIIFKELQKL
jgi:hypothetical protein